MIHRRRNGTSRLAKGALSAGRLAGMTVIYGMWLALVLLSPLDRLPFGDAEQQARGTDRSDG
jgi:hypothetical protein